MKKAKRYIAFCKRCNKDTEHYVNGHCCITCSIAPLLIANMTLEQIENKNAIGRIENMALEQIEKRSFYDRKSYRYRNASQIARDEEVNMKWLENNSGYHQMYDRINRDKINLQQNKWRKNNKDKIAKYEANRKNWGNPIILNDWFSCSDLHHLFKKVAAFIPREVHRSIYHDLEVGIGMVEINKLAIDYVYGN